MAIVTNLVVLYAMLLTINGNRFPFVDATYPDRARRSLQVLLYIQITYDDQNQNCSRSNSVRPSVEIATRQAPLDFSLSPSKLARPFSEWKLRRFYTGEIYCFVISMKHSEY